MRALSVRAFPSLSDLHIRAAAQRCDATPRRDDTYYAFLRGLPEEKLLVVYNNAPNTREINIPIEHTPLETAYQLQTILGNTSAELVTGTARLSLPSQTLAVFSVR